MATATQQKKLKALFEADPQQFGTRFEQSLGIVRNERDISRFEQDSSRREVDHSNFSFGEVMDAMCGPRWRSIPFSTYARASAQRFEGVGGAITGGETPYVSASLDVIAGLMNARALQRAAIPEWIWDRVCTVGEASGEGGFHIGKRVDPSDQGAAAGTQSTGTHTDMAEGQTPPIVKTISTRIHRNRTHRISRRAKVSYWQIKDDLTSQAMEAADEAASLPVIRERERKVIDALLGVSSGTTLSTSQTFDTQGYAPCMVQDGLTFFPYHQGTYGTNAGTAIPAQETGIVIADFANNGSGGASGGDGAGLTDYTAIVRAIQTLVKNRDPFTLLPPDIRFEGMQFLLLTPAARVQLDFLLQAETLWQILNAIVPTTPPLGAFTATTSRYNLIEKMRLEILTSQFAGNRATDVGLAYQTSTAATISTMSQQVLTFASADTYATSGSIMSAFLMGHFREALSYWQRMPYQVVGVPLSSIEYGEQVVLVQDHHEMGEAFWRNPRVVYRTWA